MLGGAAGTHQLWYVGDGTVMEKHREPALCPPPSHVRRGRALQSPLQSSVLPLDAPAGDSESSLLR